MSRTRVALGAAAILAVAVTFTFGYLALSRDRALAGSIIQAVAATITLAGVCGAALWRFTRGRARPASDTGEHLDRLAEAVTRQWDGAVMERGLRYPAPIPMRWRWSTRCISASIEDAAGLPAAARIIALPGTRRITRDDLGGGDLEDLFRVYAGLDSGRILLTGKAGAGKSSAGLLLLLRALRHRAEQENPDRNRVPVPVLLTFYGWDPRRQDFASWLTERLLGDYPDLAAAGRSTVAALVRDGRIAVFLDGLDEIPEDLRPVVVRALDHQVTHRIVLLTRVEEMVRTARGAHLSGAAALELLPVSAEEAADYLVRVSVTPLRPGCRALTSRLRRAPDGPLARAVAQPLMLALLRDRLAADDDVHELLELDHTEDIEDGLLDRVIPLSYRSAPVSPRVDELLHFLAANLTRQGVREFAWWDLPKWLPRGPRTLVTALFAGLLWGLGNGAMLFSDRWILGAGYGSIRDTLLTALLTGPMAAMFAALAVAQPGHQATARRRAGFSRTVIFTGCVCGAISAVAVLAAVDLESALFGLAGSAVLTLLLAKTPMLRRGAGGRLRMVFVDPAALSLPAGVAGVFLGAFISFLPDGVMLAFGSAVGSTLTNGLLIVFLQPPRAIAPVPFGRLRRRGTLLIGIFAATGFGLLTMFMLVDSRTGDVSSRAVITVVAGLMFFLVVLPVIGLLPRRDPSDGGVPASPLRLMRTELRSRLAGGCALGLALSLPAIPSAMLSPTPAGESVSPWMVDVLFAAETVLLLGVLGGPLFAVISSYSWQTFLVGLQMRAAGYGPWNLPRHLDDAHRRGVLRAVGPVYQFRHARLQERLSRPVVPATTVPEYGVPKKVVILNAG